MERAEMVKTEGVAPTCRASLTKAAATGDQGSTAIAALLRRLECIPLRNETRSCNAVAKARYPDYSNSMGPIGPLRPR